MGLFQKDPERERQREYEKGRLAYSRKQFRDALVHLTRAAEQGVVDAMVALGDMYARGEGVTADREQAMAWFEKAADLGSGTACLRCARLCANQRAGKGLLKAMDWAKRARESGTEEAERFLNDLAAELMTKPESELHSLFFDRGVELLGEKNFVRAKEYFQQSANLGGVAAMFNLGLMYSGGMGAPADKEMALQWFEQAARWGDAEAQYRCGLLYQSGYGLAENQAEAALQWFERAACQGLAKAMYQCAVSYAVGRRSRADLERALNWARRAQRGGYGSAADLVEEIRKKISSLPRVTEEKKAGAKREEPQPPKPVRTEANPVRAVQTPAEAEERPVEQEETAGQPVQEEMTEEDGTTWRYWQVREVYTNKNGKLVPARKAADEQEKPAREPEEDQEMMDREKAAALWAAYEKKRKAAAQREERDRQTRLAALRAEMEKKEKVDALQAVLEEKQRQEEAELARREREAAERREAELKKIEAWAERERRETAARAEQERRMSAVREETEGEPAAAREASEPIPEPTPEPKKPKRSSAASIWAEQIRKAAERAEQERRQTILPAEQLLPRWDAAPQEVNVHREKEKEEAFEQGRRCSLQGNFTEAIRHYQQAAQLGSVSAMFNLGTLFYQGEWGAPDYAQALEWFEKAAAQGSLRAQINCGYMHYKGMGSEADSSVALAWYEQAAEQGDAEAQATCARMYYNGDGTPKDLERALFWFEQAAEEGNLGAMYQCGVMYEQGLGTEPDKAHAYQMYELAAGRGSAEAQFRCGVLCYSGQGVPEDKAASLIWFEKAAEQGFVEAQMNCGTLYYNGEGTAKNRERALMWYQKAAEQGNDEAAALARKLGAGL